MCMLCFGMQQEYGKCVSERPTDVECELNAQTGEYECFGDQEPGCEDWQKRYNTISNSFGSTIINYQF